MKAKKWLILGLSAVMSVAVGIGISACGKKDHTHTYDAWDWNETQHWKYCDEHGEDKSNIDETTRADHDFSNGNCVCGAEKPADTDEADTRVFYVVGSVVDGYWHTEGTHLPLQLERTAGYTYEISLTLYKGETFKIVGFAEEPTEDPASKMYELQADYGDYAEPNAELFTASGMQDFTVAKDGVYTIKLHTDDAANTGEDTDKFSVEIERDDDITWDLYIFGTMTNWTKNEEYKMEGTGTTYTFTLNVTQDMIDTTVDSEGTKTKPALKVVNVTGSGNKYFGDGEDKNIEFEEAGEYTITFDSTTYAVTSAAKGPEDVAHDQRTFVLSGTSKQKDGTLYECNNGYDTTNPAWTFKRTIGTNTFVLENVKLYAGDKFQLRYNEKYYEGSKHYSYGPAFLYDAATPVIEKSSNWDGDAIVAVGKSGVYTITIVSKGTTYNSTTDRNSNQITVTYKLIEKLDDPELEKPDLEEGWYIVGKIAALGGENWATYQKNRFVGTDGLTVALTTSDQFKFSKYIGGITDDINWNNQIGYSAAYSTYCKDAGGNFAVKASGTYTFKITGTSLTITQVS